MESRSTVASPPRITFGLLSWNRLHYLRATLESARRCLQYPNLEWIVVDNESTEPGLREYLESCPWVDRLISKRQSHAEAMNQIVDLATGRYLILWPEDMQFVRTGDWLLDVIEILEVNPDIGSVALDFVRRQTLERLFRPRPWENRRLLVQEFRTFGRRFRRQRAVRSSRGFEMLTFGWLLPGICGSGLPSLTPIRVWKDLGPWRTTRSADQAHKDSSLGAEQDMVHRFFARAVPLQSATFRTPVAADIITDPLGCKAKVRKHHRYGVYMPPPDGTYYYRIDELERVPPKGQSLPIDFTQGVTPLGFKIPLDARGDRRKSSINDSVVYDLETGSSVPYPLRDDAGVSLVGG